MKYLVESKNNVYLHDMFGGQGVHPNRPSVVRITPFIENMRGTKLTVLAELDDDADDAMLAACKDEAELAETIELLKGEAKSEPKSAPAPSKPAPRKKA